MNLDVFDPTTHRIVAVDKDGAHLHVTLHELALDASGLELPAVDLSPIERRLAALEGGVVARPVEPGDRLAQLEARVAQLEAYVQEKEQESLSAAQLRAILTDANSRILGLERAIGEIVLTAQKQLQKGAA